MRLEGKPPRRRHVHFGADPECMKLHPDGRIPSDDIVVDAEGNVRWAFVWIKKGLTGTFPPPAEPVVLDQVGCRYGPHVLGIRTGQELIVRNSDPLLHNVHILPFENRESNCAVPNQGVDFRRTFRKPEIMVRVKCDVHPWMGAWIGVVSHPCFAVTDPQGRYEIPGLPPGAYTVEVWHERYKSASRVIRFDGNRREDFTLKLLK